MNSQFWNRNTSTVLTCLGGVGFVTTTVMAIKATPKALKKIETAEQEKGEELSKWETVKVAGTTYLPTILVGASTNACNQEGKKLDDIKEFFKLFKEDLKEWIEDNHYVLDDNRIRTQVTK